MTTATKMASLVKLSDTDLVLEDSAQDVRGRKVVDKEGVKIGEVEDLLIDSQQRKVRFLQAWEGGYGVLHLGKQRFLIPVDAITFIDTDNVYIDQTGERIAEVAVYDPTVVSEQTYWEELYGRYGYPPYWARGYRYPPYPYYHYRYWWR
jgi:sporulation protein YlmC with PRC-barrel domain